jgi:hypothetical protein
MFPNPVNEVLQIVIQQTGKHDIFLLDGLGREIKHLNDVESSSSIMMSEFDSGCYFIEVRSKGFSVVQRVVKQ